MKADAGKKKVVLELGGNAGAIVDETADLDWAVARLAFGAFAYSGQVCISVQRIYVVARSTPSSSAASSRRHARSRWVIRPIRRPTWDRWSTRLQLRVPMNG
jgi:NAD-dependent aldehyde dehydrogenases